MRYLLDTEALVWLLSSSSSFPEDLREKLEYYEDPFAVCDISLMEISTLQQLGKVKLDTTIVKIVDYLEKNGISMFFTTAKMLDQVKKLPLLTINKKRHTDPNDRIILMTAIESKCTLISSDKKFPSYERFGLKSKAI